AFSALGVSSRTVSLTCRFCVGNISNQLPAWVLYKSFLGNSMNLNYDRACSILPARPGRTMTMIQLTPGAGAMFCGNCFRDNALVAVLRKMGHEVTMVPLYLPLTLDEEDQSSGTPIFFSGINVYLEQKSELFRQAPGWVRNLFAARPLLRWAGSRAARTRAMD